MEVERSSVSPCHMTLTISTAVRTVNASSILSIISLALKKGTEVEIKAVGPDEDKALTEVTRFLESL